MCTSSEADQRGDSLWAVLTPTEAVLNKPGGRSNPNAPVVTSAAPLGLGLWGSGSGGSGSWEVWWVWVWEVQWVLVWWVLVGVWGDWGFWVWGAMGLGVGQGLGVLGGFGLGDLVGLGLGGETGSVRNTEQRRAVTHGTPLRSG